MLIKTLLIKIIQYKQKSKVGIMSLPGKVENQIMHLIEYEKDRYKTHEKQYHIYQSDHTIAKKEEEMMHEATQAQKPLHDLLVVADHLKKHLPHKLPDEQTHKLRLAYLELRKYTHDRNHIKNAQKLLADIYEDLRKAEAMHQHQL